MQVTFRLNAYSEITSVFFLFYFWGEVFWVGERLFLIIVPQVPWKDKGKESVWTRWRPLHRKAHFLGTIRDETSFRFPINMSVGLLVSLKSPQTRAHPWPHLLTQRPSFQDLPRKSSGPLSGTAVVDWKAKWLEGKDHAFPPGFPSVLKELSDPSRSPSSVGQKTYLDPSQSTGCGSGKGMGPIQFLVNKYLTVKCGIHQETSPRARDRLTFHCS